MGRSNRPIGGHLGPAEGGTGSFARALGSLALVIRFPAEEDRIFYFHQKVCLVLAREKLFLGPLRGPLCPTGNPNQGWLYYGLPKASPISAKSNIINSKK